MQCVTISVTAPPAYLYCDTLHCMHKQAKTKRNLRRRIGRTARGLTKLNKHVRGLAHFPAVLSNQTAQIAAITVMLDVFRSELEQLGCKDLKEKISKRAQELAAEWSKPSAGPNPL